MRPRIVAATTVPQAAATTVPRATAATTVALAAAAIALAAAAIALSSAGMLVRDPDSGWEVQASECQQEHLQQ